VIRPLVIAACAGLAGCGVGSGGKPAAAAKTAGAAERSDMRADDHRDVDLALQVEALPRGPTTSDTITLKLTVANLGADFTPYGYRDGTLAYLPIRVAIARDGEPAGELTVDGLTGHDSVQREVVLRGQPPGDKGYVVRVVNSADLGDRDAANDAADVTVIYGGSG
jgi:hypothetical protein